MTCRLLSFVVLSAILLSDDVTASALPSVPLLDAAAFRSSVGTLELTLVNRSIGGAATVTVGAPNGMTLSAARMWIRGAS